MMLNLSHPRVRVSHANATIGDFARVQAILEPSDKKNCLVWFGNINIQIPHCFSLISAAMVSPSFDFGQLRHFLVRSDLETINRLRIPPSNKKNIATVMEVKDMLHKANGEINHPLTKKRP